MYNLMKVRESEKEIIREKGWSYEKKKETVLQDIKVKETISEGKRLFDENNKKLNSLCRELATMTGKQYNQEFESLDDDLNQLRIIIESSKKEDEDISDGEDI
jgi:hypothetical protein